jgi:hypothetical protein
MLQKPLISYENIQHNTLFKLKIYLSRPLLVDRWRQIEALFFGKGRARNASQLNAGLLG